MRSNLKRKYLGGMIGSAPGAMVCAISGTCLGIDAIPVAWQEKLGNRAYIKGLATGLAES
ncbi:MAG: hypothetical protein ABSB32_11035 [Thermodesulfobacteriota bacterium]